MDTQGEKGLTVEGTKDPHVCPACKLPAHTLPSGACSMVHPLMARARECIDDASRAARHPAIDDAAMATNVRMATILAQEAVARLQELWMILASKRTK